MVTVICYYYMYQTIYYYDLYLQLNCVTSYLANYRLDYSMNTSVLPSTNGEVTLYMFRPKREWVYFTLNFVRNLQILHSFDVHFFHDSVLFLAQHPCLVSSCCIFYMFNKLFIFSHTLPRFQFMSID